MNIIANFFPVFNPYQPHFKKIAQMVGDAACEYFFSWFWTFGYLDIPFADMHGLSPPKAISFDLAVLESYGFLDLSKIVQAESPEILFMEK